MAKIVAIGDVHAYYGKLISLIDRLQDVEGCLPGEYQYVFLGDLVDGGKQAKEVITLVREMQRAFPGNVIVLKGNHEDMLVDCVVNGCRIYGDYGLWWHQGGSATAKSFKHGRMSWKIPGEVLAWLAGLPLEHETASFKFVHAGYLPERYREYWRIEADPRLWVRDEFILDDTDWGKRVVFGHTYHEQPLVMPNKIGVDTMHHGGGRLTAVVLDDDAPDEMRFVASEE